jgi:hypothetical protein
MPAHFGLLLIDWDQRRLTLSLRGTDGAALRELALAL